MSTDEIADFGCTKNELIEAVHAGANRDDVARIEGAVWRLFDRVSGLRYFMDARTSLLAELENEKRQTRAAAARLDELERENAELRELRRVSFMQMLAVLRQCSDRLEIFNSSFSDIDPLSDTIVQYRSDANDSFVLERRAALAGSEKP